MRFYLFLMRRYDHSWQQIRCLAVYLPLFTGLYLIANFTKWRLPLVYHLLMLFLGWLTATFIEYMLHRFWMHDPKDCRELSPIAAYHNYHHTHPSELKVTLWHRIAFLLIGVFVLILCFWWKNGFTFYAGLYLGFCSYAFMHKAIHQSWAMKFFPKLTRYHIYHHCKFPHTCFGVTVTWWDDFFKTVPPKKAAISERIIEFYLHSHNK